MESKYQSKYNSIILSSLNFISHFVIVISLVFLIFQTFCSTDKFEVKIVDLHRFLDDKLNWFPYMFVILGSIIVSIIIIALNQVMLTCSYSLFLL